MASRHQVTCIVPDSRDADQRIDAIGAWFGGSTGGSWKLPIDTAIARIEDGTYSFFVSVQGREVDIVVARRASGRKYLKTTADAFEPNNLLALQTCK